MYNHIGSSTCINAQTPLRAFKRTIVIASCASAWGIICVQKRRSTESWRMPVVFSSVLQGRQAGKFFERGSECFRI